MPGNARLEALFNLFSKNYEAARQRWPQLPGGPDTVLCPICRQVFGRPALEKPAPGRPAGLSFEHSIPSAVGGTDAMATLVCTGCNNRDGRLIDAHISERLEVEAFAEGYSERPRKAVLAVRNLRASVDWTFRGGDSPASDLRIVAKATREGTPERMKEVMTPGAVPRLDLSFPLRYDPRIAHVAMLRMAYLVAFRKFGYGFALNECMTPVVRQILNPTEQVIPSGFCLEWRTAPIDETAILLVRKPCDRRSLLVVLKMRVQNRTVLKGVVLPGPFDTGAAIFARLADACARNEPFDVEAAANLDEYEIDLTDPHHLLALPAIWSELCQD